MVIRTRIIRIGNSQGVRIPKPLLEQSGITGDVELEIAENKIIIHSVDHPRTGWEAAFKEMADHGDDDMVDPNPAGSRWDEEEWQW